MRKLEQTSLVTVYCYKLKDFFCMNDVFADLNN